MQGPEFKLQFAEREREENSYSDISKISDSVFSCIGISKIP
jgi:hypothetical protein